MSDQKPPNTILTRAADLPPDRLHIVARDELLPKASASMLTLTDGGLAKLEEFLAGARDAGSPFGFVVLDSSETPNPPPTLGSHW